MTISTYQVGDLLRIGNHAGDTARTAFLNVSGVATDPTVVTFTVRKPDGTTTAYVYGTDAEVQKEAATTGRYYMDLSLDQSGIWTWELAGTGAVETAEQSQFRVARRWVA
jgi:hypothetical protein